MASSHFGNMKSYQMKLYKWIEYRYGQMETEVTAQTSKSCSSQNSFKLTFENFDFFVQKYILHLV
jgi:hypothetical protein